MQFTTFQTTVDAVTAAPMGTIMFAVFLLYILVGVLFWRFVVIKSLTEMSATSAGSEAVFALASERQGSAHALVVRLAVIATWPFLAAFGYIATRCTSEQVSATIKD